MDITFVLPHANLGGGTRVIAIYAERLSRLGHNVVVISTPQRSIPLQGKLRSVLRGEGWPRRVRRSPSHFDGVGLDHRVLDRWRPVCDADLPDADVVVATWWETAEWVASLAPEKGAKVYFLQHYEVHETQPIDRVKATWRLPIRKVVISQWLADIACNEFGDTDVSIVRNAVDEKQFFAPPRGKQDQPTVGMLYRPIEWKGCDIAIEAYRIAQSRIPNLRLVAFGTDDPMADPPLSEGARYSRFPAQDTIREIYASCDAWLFASRREGFGLPILEAMACRTPVIGTPAGAAPELLANGAGLLVKPGDPRDMAEAIERICAMDETEWAALSSRAHEVATGYTWDDAMDLFLDAMNRTIAKSRGTSDGVSTAPEQGNAWAR